MTFETLQENLRRLLRQRIEAGALTGLGLAQQTGFRQAHISNFLNGKRGLSSEGMDKVLRVQKISVLDLLGRQEPHWHIQAAAEGKARFENVCLVEGAVAATSAIILSSEVKDILLYRKDFLEKLRPAPEARREPGERFVAIRADRASGRRMHPRLRPGAVLLLDRHYTGLKPHARVPNIYAVRKNGDCVISYVEVAGDRILLRPHNREFAIEVLAGKDPAKVVVGRVCHASLEM
jgi:hypothetical protein